MFKKLKKIAIIGLAMIMALAAFSTLAACDNTTDEITLESIAITTNPTKTTYQEGEAFSSEGMVVTATYSNADTKIVTSYTYSTEVLSVGTNSVAINYTENGITKSATVAVTVETARILASIVITTPATKLEYLEDEIFDSTGMVVTANFTDSTNQTVTGYSVKPQNATEADAELTIFDTYVTVSIKIGTSTKTARQNVTVNEDSREKVVVNGVSYGRSDLTFTFNSDMHISGAAGQSVLTNYPIMMTEVKRMTANRVTAIVNGGDYSEGVVTHGQKLVEMTRNTFPTTPIVAAYGNHEGIGKHNQFTEIFGHTADYIYTAEIPKFTFISFDLYEDDPVYADPVAGIYRYTNDPAFIAKAELAIKASIAEDPTRPIVVVEHVPTPGTTGNSGGDMTGIGRLHNMLKNYPQVIFLCGHNHSSKALYKGDYIAQEIGSFGSSPVFCLFRYTNKGYLIIEYYTVASGSAVLTNVGGVPRHIINYNEFLASKAA